MPIQGTPTISSAASQTLTAAASIYVYTGTTAATWTLPSISGNTGELLILYNRGTGTVTVQRAGSDKINSQGNLVNLVTLPPSTSLQMINDGTVWLPISSASGTGPAYDNAAIASSNDLNVSSGTAFTWTQTVASGNPYGVIAVVGDSGSTVTPAGATPVVSLGGVALSSLGSYSAGSYWVWFFGAPNIPSGTQTASVKLTQSGKTFNGNAFSATYFNVGYVPPLVAGTYIPTDGSSRTTLPRSTAGPGVVLIATAWQAALNILTGMRRATTNGTNYAYAFHDLGTYGSWPTELDMECTSAYPVAASGLAGALELVSTPPTGPHLADPITTSTSSSWNHTATAGTYLIVAISAGPFASAITGVTNNGTAMTLLASVWQNNDTSGSSGQTFFYGMPSVSAGANAIHISGTSSVAATSLTFANVSSVGTALTAFGGGATATQSVTCSASQLIVQGFGMALGAANDPPVGSYGFTASAVNTGATAVISVTHSMVSANFQASVGGAWASVAVVLS